MRWDSIERIYSSQSFRSNKSGLENSFFSVNDHSPTYKYAISCMSPSYTFLFSHIFCPEEHHSRCYKEKSWSADRLLPQTITDRFGHLPPPGGDHMLIQYKNKPNSQFVVN